MRYLKAFIIGLLALVSVVFVIENIEVLRQSINLRLNLYVANIETSPIELWVLTILSFALGAVLVLIYFVYDHIRQRQVIRQLRQNVEILGAELKRTGVAVEAATSPSAPSPETRQQ
ncbi:MAG: LapA family protein [Desulfobaccales bacterium]